MCYVSKSVLFPLKICADASTKQPTANSQQQPTTIIMAATSRKKSIVPHRRPLTPHQQVGLIGDNPLNKRICFSPGMGRSMALKTLFYYGNDA
jgi:hypothetical protein